MRRLSAAVVLLACAGCDQAAVDSCGVPTDAISLVAIALENGPTLRAEVDFTTEDASGEHGLALCDKDKLLIGGEEADEVDRPDRVIYSHTSEMTATRTVDLELQRDGEESVAFTITIPPAFDVIAPIAAAEISRSAPFLIEWSPPNTGEMMRIELAEEIGNGVCLETQVAEHDYKGPAGVDIDDDGSWEIPAAVIDSGAREKCDASYRFTRLASSAYPASLHSGGYLEGRVERLVAFVSVP